MNLGFAIQRLADRLPWRVAHRLRRRFPPTLGHCKVISGDPAVIIIPEDFYDNLALWRPFFEDLRKKKVYFVCVVRGGIEADPNVYRKCLQTALSDHRARYQSHRFIFLPNNGVQQEIYERLGLKSVLVNHNAFVDEQVFTVIPDSYRRYDAIYNAVMMPYKRHELAATINSLALITYFKTGCDNYVSGICEALKDAAWLNFGGHRPEVEDYRMIPQADVVRYLNQARVGLCLSESEGAMFASIEYLLCGLSIVSTPSIGGRDVFFDSEYVEIAEADAESVRRGVARMVARRVSPEHIRKKTLGKVAEHRAALVNLVVRIYDQEAKRIDRDEAYGRLFSTQIYQLRELHRLAAVSSGNIRILE